MGLRKRLALDLYSGLYRQMAEEHILRELFWESTLRCNLNCRHCGSDCKAVANTPDMPVADFLKAVDTLTPHIDPHRMLVIFTGGEPLMRRDLEQAGRALYDRGYPWGMVTNGMLLERRRMESLLGAGLHSITLSLDGFEEQHNYIRRNAESYRNALRALRLIVGAPQITYDVVTCANSDNFASLPAFKEFLISEGVKAWRIFTVFPVGRGAEDPRLQLPDEQFRQLMEFIAATRKEGRIGCSYGCEGFLGSYEAEVRDNFFGCMAGIGIAGIRIDGAISGCTSIRGQFDQGNIYRDNLWEVWQNRFERYRNREWTRKEGCADCKVFKYCHGNGMHLYDDNEQLLVCHYKRLFNTTK